MCTETRAKSLLTPTRLSPGFELTARTSQTTVAILNQRRLYFGEPPVCCDPLDHSQRRRRPWDLRVARIRLAMLLNVISHVRTASASARVHMKARYRGAKRLPVTQIPVVSSVIICASLAGGKPARRGTMIGQSG
jgi:hypothetical protein